MLSLKSYLADTNVVLVKQTRFLCFYWLIEKCLLCICFSKLQLAMRFPCASLLSTMGEIYPNFVQVLLSKLRGGPKKNIPTFETILLKNCITENLNLDVELVSGRTSFENLWAGALLFGPGQITLQCHSEQCCQYNHHGYPNIVEIALVAEEPARKWRHTVETCLQPKQNMLYIFFQTKVKVTHFR